MALLTSGTKRKKSLAWTCLIPCAILLSAAFFIGSAFLVTECKEVIKAETTPLHSIIQITLVFCSYMLNIPCIFANIFHTLLTSFGFQTLLDVELICALSSYRKF